MKPSFALNLTEDGVTLLHRTARGWMDVGTARFDDPDLPAALDYLRGTALGLSPKGISSKLVIPNSQILYTKVAAPGPSDKDRRAQIAKALEGRTPYDVSDLAFDWSGDGPEVEVAVVARETLAEAEAFANEHRFNPVSFVALPETGFDREPFFGASEAAESILTKGQKVERDTEVIKIISRDQPKAESQPAPEPPTPDASPAAAPAPAETAEKDAAPSPEPSVEPTVKEETVKPSLAEPSGPATDAHQAKRDDTPSTIASEPAPEPPADQNTPEKDAPAKVEQDTEPKVVLTVAEEDIQAAPSPTPKDALADDKAPEPAKEPGKAAIPTPSAEPDEAPMAVDVDLDDDIPPMPAHLRHRITAPQSPADDSDLPPMPSAAAQMAFASRRGPNDPPLRRPPPGSDDKPASAGKPVPDSAAAPRTTAPKAPVVDRPAAAKPPPKFSYDDPVPPPPRMPGDPPLTPPPAVAKASKTLRSPGSLITDPTLPRGTEKRSKPAKPVPATAINPAEGANTTVNPASLGKGLGAARPRQRGKPRFLGLILTGILLLILALIAAWSSFYLARKDDTPPTQTAAVAPVAAPETVDTSLPSATDEAAADGVDLASTPAATTGLEATPPAETTTTADTALSTSSGPEPAPKTGLETEAASTDSAPSDQAQDEIFLAGTDQPPSATDPLTLTPPAASGDALPDAPMPPPPFGTVYKFDADGRIVPTAAGVVTPDGVLLIAGRPSPLPPERPASITAAAAALAPAAEAAAPALAPADLATPAIAADNAPQGVTPEQTFAADPTLAAGRPKLRPADLAPAAPAAGKDDASLAPAVDSRFASLRPRLRPASVVAAGEESRRAAEAASLAAQASLSAATNAAVAMANADGSVSPLTVDVSRVPAPRPRDLNRAVEAAVAAAIQPSNRASEPDTTAHAQSDEGDAEPEPVSAAPRIPTKANVAKQATYVNAINLSKINLIGVYGTQSRRYALIRQANGRYKKVSVGDSIDGGTVRAITANEVRYQKGGRLLSLTMPEG